MSEASLVSLLAARFAPPAWAFIPQVPNGTGGHKSRTADAIAMSVWPSRGLHLHGFEIKVSRSDWLRELKSPDKAESVAVYCDRWWIVVSDPAIVQPGELPPTWGLLTRKAGGLKLIVDAPALDAKPLSRPMLAALLRRFAESSVPKAAVADRIEAAREEGLKSAKVYERTDLEVCRRQLASLQKTVGTFEAESGVDISHGWSIGEIGKAVAVVRKFHLNGQWPTEEARLVHGHLQRCADELKAAVEAIEAIHGQPAESMP